MVVGVLIVEVLCWCVEVLWCDWEGKGDLLKKWKVCGKGGEGGELIRVVHKLLCYNGLVLLECEWVLVWTGYT